MKTVDQHKIIQVLQAVDEIERAMEEVNQSQIIKPHAKRAAIGGLVEARANRLTQINGSIIDVWV